MSYWFSTRFTSAGLSLLLIATMVLNGCVSTAYVKEPQRVARAGLGSWDPLWKQSSNKNELSEPSISKILQQIEDRATPEEWAAVQCLGAAAVDYGTVTQQQSGDLLQLLGVTRALSALPDSPQHCASIKLLDVEVTFWRDGLFHDDSLWNVVWVLPYAAVCGGSLFTVCPVKVDRMARISAVAETAPGCRIRAEGLGAATWLAPNPFPNEDNAAIVALAEALKAMATNLKGQIATPCHPAPFPVRQDATARSASPASAINDRE